MKTLSKLSNKLVCIVFITTFFYCCNQQNAGSKNHKSRLELNDKFPDSLLFNIPDSLKQVATLLRKVHLNDQKYRDIDDYTYLFRNEKEQKKFDSFNQVIVDSLLKIHGLLSPKKIGIIAYKGQMGTLTHAGIDFKEKYLTLVKSAFIEKKIFATHYALFVDKYMTQKSKLQIFGTQYITHKGKLVPYPFDITQINNNRNKIGLTNIFNEKATLLNVGMVDSLNCGALFPLIIHERKIDTVVINGFTDF